MNGDTTSYDAAKAKSSAVADIEYVLATKHGYGTRAYRRALERALAKLAGKVVFE